MWWTDGAPDLNRHMETCCIRGCPLAIRRAELWRNRPKDPVASIEGMQKCHGRNPKKSGQNPRPIPDLVGRDSRGSGIVGHNVPSAAHLRDRRRGGTTNIAFDDREKDLYVTVVKNPNDHQAKGSVVMIPNVE